jgi:hypothetical protein
MSNEVVKQALDQIEAATNSQSSNQDLSALFARIAGITAKLRFDHTKCSMGVGGSVILFLFAINLNSSGAALLLIPAFVIGGISGALIVTRESRWTRISKKLQALYEANLMQLDAEEFDPKEKAEELGSCYFEFQRGNYEREVLSLHSGLAEGNTADIPYQLIEFHWVDRRIVTRVTTDENGNRIEKEEEVFDHYYRTALLAEIDIQIDAYIQSYPCESMGVQWETASGRFNRIYTVHGESEIVLAKLLKPALVLLMEQLSTEYSDLNFEFCTDSTMLVSMRRNNLLDASIDVDLSDPAVAAEQLLVAASQPKIRRILSVCDEVSRFTISELRRNR